ncbi:MAG: cbb3-type cytochrome c oxidase subunit I [Geminicoccaceae bacterium]|nr:cbb3-type cytochrome c oxidase subunit I [Geminicoccaceae bacterium]MCS7268265.1 cbb3-type cytochrome c oxidase subunit I [Geminicoccaceae bacterium]MDW8125129.1 cbb3-type cytochrome c oxidase subunit I [Geminicoccaceae bacterium]MDW8340904.1 cbb3-type cytochrome c oxidase subunit I [Geminicoccaceae bacterium]
MTPLAAAVRAAPILEPTRLALVSGGLVFLLMMTLGLLMKATQAGFLPLEPRAFYEVMTAHGIGMVGTAGLTGVAVLWHFLGRYVELDERVFWAFLASFLSGVVLILGAVFVGGFAAAWTFLYPLPAISGGVWAPETAVVYLAGLALVGTGFLLLHLECARALRARWGGLAHALGWPLLFRGAQDPLPPPAVVAAAAVTVFNLLGLVVGAAVIAISILDIVIPAASLDPLLAKNMIYFFGHVFINATIYMAVIAVYEIIPEYTGRPWTTSRIFVAAWSVLLLFVMAVYPHHLLQDTVMPAWTLAVGQILSYGTAVPLVAVTTLGLLSQLHRSGARLDLPAALLVLGVGGWTAGVMPAWIDGIVAVNKVMHNTLWVPGHFHMYLILGQVAFVWAVLLRLARGRDERGLSASDGIVFWLYLLGGAGLALGFLIAGAASVPRRWAVHDPAWIVHDVPGVLFAVMVLAGAAGFFAKAVPGLLARGAAQARG